jgi:phosphatidylglycerophosphate synthase
LRRTKRLADALTCLRPILAICLAWLGIAAGKAVLPSVLLITIATWVTDVFDGYLARRDVASSHTWVGDHDAEADLSVSLGLLFYLVFSGYLPAGCALLGPLIVAVWVLASHQLAWPLYAIPYLALIYVGFGAAPVHAWIAVIYLLAATALTWPRLPEQFLPEFFAAVRGRAAAEPASEEDR